MKVVVGLSGGVDSAVSAALLKEQGHEVVGVFMKNWSGDEFGLKGDCPWEQDQEDARKICEHLGIEFRSFNFELQYRDRVIEYFFREYKAGRTPNPDILCNSEIKFNIFLKKCLLELDAEKIATGHYARVMESTVRGKRVYHLHKGVDANKDQSYFLCQLTQDELARTLFPVGHLTKPEVRAIAEEKGIPVAKKKDSQGICFVGKINVREFIRSELGDKPGPIIDADTGKELGTHQGLWFHTIGQREGLGLAGGPWFVVNKDLAHNTLLVAKGSENQLLYSSAVVLKELNIINPDEMSSEFVAEASLRYRQKPNPCEVKFAEGNGSEIVLEFLTPQRAVTPGQFGAIYKGDELISSGVIQ